VQGLFFLTQDLEHEDKRYFLLSIHDAGRGERQMEILIHLSYSLAPMRAIKNNAGAYICSLIRERDILRHYEGIAAILSYCGCKTPCGLCRGLLVQEEMLQTQT